MNERPPNREREPPHGGVPPDGSHKMWLSDLSIRQPVFVSMLVLATMVVGGVLYSRMGLDLFPDISLPVAVVQTVYPGASPEEVERSVTKPLEDAVAAINDVENVRSISSDSSSVVIVEFNMSKDGKEAADEVQSRVDAIRNTLPSDVKEPVILRFDPAAAPIVVFAIADSTGSRSPEELRTLADEVIKPRIERVAGVAASSVVGGRTREIHVDLKRSELEAHSVAPQQVIQAIRGENLDIPAGRVPEGEQDESLRVAGAVQSLAQLEDIPIVSRPNGVTVRVQDVADVSEGFAEVRALSRLDGRESLTAEVRKQSGTNTVQVADAVKRELTLLQQEYPELSFAVAFDQSTFAREAVQDVQFSLVLGAILAALVVLMFFRDLRNTLVTVAGLPMILLGTFGVLDVLGISLNMISLMALSLSVGMLIDDAIVVRENIFRHMERGVEPKVAASRGTAEIALAVLAVSTTIVAVFLPIAFTEGIAGKFLRDFGITVAAAVVISMIEAFTLAPMLSAHFFKRIHPASRQPGRIGPLRRLFSGINHGYRTLLGWSLRHRFVVVLVGVVSLVGSLALLPLMVFSFSPQTDQGEFGVGLELAPGARLEETDRLARIAEQVIQDDPAVAHIFTSVGSSSGAVGQAMLNVKLDERGHTDATITRLRPKLEKELTDRTGAKLSFDRESSSAAMGGGAAASAIQGQPIQFTVEGQDFQLLDQVSSELAARLRQVPGVVDVDRSIQAGQPGQAIQVDRTKTSDLGITISHVGSTVRALVNGERAGTFRTEERDIDIIVRLGEADRTSMADVLRVPIVTQRGIPTALSEVASLAQSTEPSQILRENRQRQVAVGGNHLGRNLGSALAAARASADAMELPPGVTVQVSGQARYMDEMFASLGLAVGLSVIFVYMILASQFGSFIQPLTIMLALPFSLVGALFALFAGKFDFDMLAMIGIILLMGLVTKNSILLVEFISQLKRRGASTREAILDAGPIRLRPILMTTLAMIFGMAPVAAGVGAGSELRQPMGVAVVGGLITSALLTLVIVPVAYSLVDDLRHALTRPADAVEPSALRTMRRLATPSAVLATLALLSGAGLYSAGLLPSPQSETTTPTATPFRAASVRAVSIPTVTSAPATAVAESGTDRATPTANSTGGAPSSPALGRRRVVNTNGLGVNLRESPGADARRIGGVAEGTAVEPLGETTESGGRTWIKVRDSRGAVGWVAGDYVAASAETSP